MVIQEYECMSLQDVITTEFVGTEVGKDGSKTLIGSVLVLDGVVVSALARKTRGLGSSPGPG